MRNLKTAPLLALVAISGQVAAFVPPTVGSGQVAAFVTPNVVPEASSVVTALRASRSADAIESRSTSTTRRDVFVKASAAVTAGLVAHIQSAAADDSGSLAAAYAYRSGGLPSLRPLGLGLLQRYEGYVEAPAASSRKQIFITFDFPSDWLQLDKLGGGIQYVDQRNGDKLYVLRAPLPEGESLVTVPKAFFASSIFDPAGDIVRSGTVIEGGKTSKSTILNECAPADQEGCRNRRRLILKYDTVTGSGIQTVERRGLVDAYEVDGTANPKTRKYLDRAFGTSLLNTRLKAERQVFANNS